MSNPSTSSGFDPEFIEGSRILFAVTMVKSVEGLRSRNASCTQRFVFRVDLLYLGKRHCVAQSGRGSWRDSSASLVCVRLC